MVAFRADSHIRRGLAYWLYFLQFRNRYIASHHRCCLPETATLELDGRPKVAVTFERPELLKFLKADFLPMNLICERAEMFEERIRDRSKAIFEYFGLPLGGED